LRGFHLDRQSLGALGEALNPVRIPLQAVRSASAGGSPDTMAALEITAAAYPALISPEATISPARQPPQKVIALRSPSAALATFRTKPASAC
jgi:hypothetical protein